MRGSLFPSETCPRLNEIHIQLLLIFGWLGTKKWYFRISSQTSNKNFNSLEHIRNPMFQRITKSEDVNTPSDNIIVLNRVHVLPGELEMRAKSEAMDVNFGSSSQNISFSTKLSTPAHRTHLHRDSINVVNLEVGEVNDHPIETVIFTSLQSYSLVVGMVTNVSHVCCSKFEKLRIRSFLAIKELSSPLRILSGIKNSCQNLSIGILTFHRIGSLLEDDLLDISMILVQEDLSKLCLLPQEITHTLNDLRLAEIVSKSEQKQQAEKQHYPH